MRPYQLEAARAIVASVLNGLGRTFTVLFPRQAGKNELSAQVEAFLLYRHRELGGSLVKCAPTFRPQLINSLMRLERLLRGPLTTGEWRRRAGYMLELGKATALFLSGERRASVVGATASLLLEADEAQDLDTEKWDRDFRPMAATTAATSVLYGTPWTDDTLLAQQVRLNQELEQRDGQRRHFEVRWETVAELVPAYGRYVEGEIERLGATHPVIRTQYLLQPLGRGGRFLDAVQLAMLRGDHPPQQAPGPGPWRDGVYVAGLDVAGADEQDPETLLTAASPGRDATALTIAFAERVRRERVIESKYHVVRQYVWQGTQHSRLYPQVLSLVRDVWRCAAVVVDATGVGSGMAAFLGQALGPRIVLPYVYNAQTKSQLAYDFLAAVNAGRFKLHRPADDAPELYELLRQLEAAEYAIRGNQVMSFFVPESKGHDDQLNAAVLLVQGAPLAAARTAIGRRVGW